MTDAAAPVVSIPSALTRGQALLDKRRARVDKFCATVLTCLVDVLENFQETETYIYENRPPTSAKPRPHEGAPPVKINSIDLADSGCIDITINNMSGGPHETALLHTWVKDTLVPNLKAKGYGVTPDETRMYFCIQFPIATA